MKDVICNAHYAPGYLYEAIRVIGLPEEYDPWLYSDRVDEYCEYRTWHWPGSYASVGHESEEYRAEFVTPDKEGCVIPNWPIEKYDTVARREWEESYGEPWPYCDIYS